MDKFKIFYINSTHWDREWYVPFQYFRFNLVESINELIDILQSDPEYKCFCTDGQTVILEDYEETNKENAKKLRDFVERGRIKIGPWYTMPDEFLVSGESLIKNLMIGHKVAKEWGTNAWKFGYECDVFGHIAQMPQILSGFDIHGGFISRGLGNTDFTHFCWESPDGTESFFTVSQYGYLFLACRDWFKDKKDWPDMLKKYIETAKSRTNTNIVLIQNGSDHAVPDRRTPYVYDLIRELYPNAEIYDDGTEDLYKLLKENQKFLPKIKGELIKTAEFEDITIPESNLMLLQNCLSSYYPLKWENDFCQNMIEKRIEPMIAFAKLQGDVISRDFLEVAYKQLLKNHAHDSICGCSIDDVHKDMEYRFDQTKHILNRLYERFLEFEDDIIYKKDDEYEYQLKLYNFQNYEKNEYITVDISFYKDFFEEFNGFKIYDANNNEIEYQIISISNNVIKRKYARVKTMGAHDSFDVYTVSLKTTIPAMGYATLRVVPDNDNIIKDTCMMCGTNWVENNLIRLDILPDGSLNIKDKKTGQLYSNLLKFADCAEVGDGWISQRPENDVEIISDNKAEISLLAKGENTVVFKIKKTFELPECFDIAKNVRSDQKEELIINTTVAINRDSNVVKINTKINNNIKDHKLSLRIPTGITGDNYFAGQAFYRNIRKIGIDTKTLSWQEPEQHQKNMNGIIGKCDKNGIGLAFVSAQGLHEAGVYKDNTITVTLFRSFRKIVLDIEGIRSQLQREMEFSYAIVPMNSEIGYSELLKVQNVLSNADIYISKRVLKNTQSEISKSFIAIDNKDIFVSIFKRAENDRGYILRVFNVNDESCTANINVNFDYLQMYECNMMENILHKVEKELKFRPWEIKTILIETL